MLFDISMFDDRLRVRPPGFLNAGPIFLQAITCHSLYSGIMACLEEQTKKKIAEASMKYDMHPESVYIKLQM